MQWIAIGTPRFTDIATFDAVGATFDGEPDGLEARWVGRVGDELRVIMVWTSREQAERFFADGLRPALAAQAGPAQRPACGGPPRRRGRARTGARSSSGSPPSPPTGGGASARHPVLGAGPRLGHLLE